MSNILRLGVLQQGNNNRFDADYKAVITYATAQGYTLPSASQRTIQNQLMIDLKSAGVWGKTDSFAVFATDGNSDFALIDWKRLITMDAVNAPAYTVNQGFKGDGTSAYIDTKFSPANNGVHYQLNSCSFGYYCFSVLNTDTRVNIGTRDESTIARAFPIRDESRLHANTNSNTNRDLSAFSTRIGLRHFARVASDRCEMYDDLGFVGFNENPSGQVAVQPFYLFAMNSIGTADFHTLTDMSFSFMGGDLTAEHGDFNTALKTYMGAI